MYIVYICMYVPDTVPVHSCIIVLCCHCSDTCLLLLGKDSRSLIFIQVKAVRLSIRLILVCIIWKTRSHSILYGTHSHSILHLILYYMRLILILYYYIWDPFSFYIIWDSFSFYIASHSVLYETHSHSVLLYMGPILILYYMGLILILYFTFSIQVPKLYQKSPQCLSLY